MDTSMQRKIGGPQAFNSADTKTKGGNPVQNWEAKLNDGCQDPFTTTVVSLKARNGRSGSRSND